MQGRKIKSMPTIWMCSLGCRGRLVDGHPSSQAGLSLHCASPTCSYAACTNAHTCLVHLAQICCIPPHLSHPHCHKMPELVVFSCCSPLIRRDTSLFGNVGYICKKNIYVSYEKAWCLEYLEHLTTLFKIQSMQVVLWIRKSLLCQVVLLSILYLSSIFFNSAPHSSLHLSAKPHICTWPIQTIRMNRKYAAPERAAEFKPTPSLPREDEGMKLLFAMRNIVFKNVSWSGPNVFPFFAMV